MRYAELTWSRGGAALRLGLGAGRGVRPEIGPGLGAKGESETQTDHQCRVEGGERQQGEQHEYGDDDGAGAEVALTLKEVGEAAQLEPRARLTLAGALDEGEGLRDQADPHAAREEDGQAVTPRE